MQLFEKIEPTRRTDNWKGDEQTKFEAVKQMGEGKAQN